MPRKRIPPQDELIAIGVIRKAHGIRGEASVEPLTDSMERFSELSEVILVSPDRQTLRPARIGAARAHAGRALLHFDGIDTPQQIRELYNWSLEIRPDQLRELEKGEYFIHELLGLEVVSRDGQSIGLTTDVQEAAGGVLLTVKTADGKTFEVPFAASICTEVDTRRKRLVTELPEGLSDLDRVTAVEDEPGPATASLRIDVLTIFPDMFDSLLEEGILARARKAGLLQLKIWDLRDFTKDKHRSTDDESYGGGSGMVMLGEPIFRCMDALRREGRGEPWVVLMSPQGRRFEHAAAEELARKPWLVLLCGRYEGVDERVREAIVDEDISVGDFVVSGGEIPAMLVLDAVARMVEGVVGNWNSVKADSFYSGLLDHPHYTRPADLRGMKVPDVLLSGHAENIRKWRKEQSLRATLTKRPDLLENAELDDEATQMLKKIRRET